MPTHTYSTVLYDVSWQDIGSAMDAVQQLDEFASKLSEMRPLPSDAAQLTDENQQRAN